MKEATRGCGGRAALWKFNGGRGWVLGVPRLCRSAGHMGLCGKKELAGKDNVVGSGMEEDRSGDLLGARQRDRERAQARRECEFEGESFHAASGGERS